MLMNGKTYIISTRVQSVYACDTKDGLVQIRIHGPLVMGFLPVLTPFSGSKCASNRNSEKEPGTHEFMRDFLIAMYL